MKPPAPVTNTFLPDSCIFPVPPIVPGSGFVSLALPGFGRYSLVNSSQHDFCDRLVRNPSERTFARVDTSEEIRYFLMVVRAALGIALV